MIWKFERYIVPACVGPLEGGRSDPASSRVASYAVNRYRGRPTESSRTVKRSAVVVIGVDRHGVATTAPISLKTIPRTSPATATHKGGRACTAPKITSDCLWVHTLRADKPSAPRSSANGTTAETVPGVAKASTPSPPSPAKPVSRRRRVLPALTILAVLLTLLAAVGWACGGRAVGAAFSAP
jgi:hypothetical protein